MKVVIIKGCHYFNLGFQFCKNKYISKAKINKKAEIGSPWQVPLPSEKYFLVVPPVTIHKTPELLVKFLPIRSNFDQSHIFLQWKLKNCDLLNQMISQCLLQLKILIFFILAISVTSDINLPLSLICLFLTYAVKRLNLVKFFLVSLKELLILFLDLHLIKSWVSNFLWISYLSSFSVNLMIACLWDILKYLFSLVSNTESAKISFRSFQNVSWNSFVKPSLLGNL